MPAPALKRLGVDGNYAEDRTSLDIVRYDPSASLGVFDDDHEVTRASAKVLKRLDEFRNRHGNLHHLGDAEQPVQRRPLIGR